MLQTKVTYDAIVIGAGHNGLTAAAYLQRAGLSTCVLERRSIVGGCAVTEEIDPVSAPRARVSTASYIASMLRPEVIRDLRLGSYGLRMVPCEPLVQAAFQDGSVVAWWSNEAKMREELQRVAPGDCERFFETDRELKQLARYLEPFFLQPPPEVDATGIKRLQELWRMVWPFRRLRGAELTGLLTLLTCSLGDYLDRRFDSEKIKRLILANSLYGKHGGPYQPGTAMGLLFHLLSGGSEERAGFQGHVIGGMGMITETMRRACTDLGVHIRTDCCVHRIDTKAGRASGVTLEGGESLNARIVISNADPKTTFLQLITPGDLESDFVRAVRGIRMNGPCAKVNFVLSEEPSVNGMPPARSPVERSTFTLIPTLQEAEDCYNAAHRGEIPAELWIDCVVASNVDSTLTAAGEHVMTCFVQYLPYAPRDGSWSDHRERLGERVTEIIGRYAPNVPQAIIARCVLTPYDLEQRFGIAEGNIFHGDIALDQLFVMRPLPGYAHYRTPIEGLYLCGAGTHPGGGVTGAPGYNAAHVILDDLRRRRMPPRQRKRRPAVESSTS